MRLAGICKDCVEKQHAPRFVVAVGSLEASGLYLEYGDAHCKVQIKAAR